MYVIIDKKTHAILHMSNSLPEESRKPEELLPSFDPKTMQFGRAKEQRIPPRFSIENGEVKDLDAPAPAPAETLDQARERKLRELSDQSMSLRRQIMPDHELLNAGLGLYEEGRTQSIRATAAAFRDEYLRLKASVAKAKSIKSLDALEPAFPRTAVVPKTKPPKG